MKKAKSNQDRSQKTKLRVLRPLFVREKMFHSVFPEHTERPSAMKVNGKAQGHVTATGPRALIYKRVL